VLRLEQLESREVPAFIPVTPGYTATQTGAFLDPQHPSDVMRVTTYPGDGMGGRLTVSRNNSRELFPDWKQLKSNRPHSRRC
jgi:hypothetical protein